MLNMRKVCFRFVLLFFLLKFCVFSFSLHIVAGMPETDMWRISDRESAIKRALSEARAGDCVLLAGKGHERFQIVDQRKYPFDERAIIMQNLRVSGIGGAV